MSERDIVERLRRMSDLSTTENNLLDIGRAADQITTLRALLYRVERHGDASGDQKLMADIRAALPEGGWTDGSKE